MVHKVFISYAHEDKFVAEDIYAKLDHLGINAFLDEKNIGIGERITLAVNGHLMSSSILVVIISPASIKSNWVMLELGQAIAMSKTILPYLIHPSQDVPDVLRDTKCTSDFDSLISYFSSLAKKELKREEIAPIRQIEVEAYKIQEFDYIVNLKRSSILKLKVPNLEFFSSYEPIANENKYLQLRVQTTDGLVKTTGGDNVTQNVHQENVVYLICDPVRPFAIQIGETRMNRPEGKIEGVKLQGGDDVEKLKNLYPAIIDDDHKWMRTVIAELSTSEKVLDYIYEFDSDEEIKKIATRNPYASESLKSCKCRFCNEEFLKERVVFEYNTAKIFPNDYPYGPYFHYIALPAKPIHSWQNISETHLVDMNIAIKRLLDSSLGEKSLGGSVGVRVGFNSSIRHLVMGKATSTAAGASIPHIHKQIWGMAFSSFNLGDHLCALSDAYENEGVDYLGSYLDSIEKNKFLIWEDDNVSLFIPFGQIAVHELQIMLKRVGAYTYLDLTEDEIRSLSKAEFIVTRIYHKLGINSFNEVLITKSFYKDIGRCFRLILTFITREVDLAVSELNLVYVVDKHPTDTRKAIQRIWPKLSEEYNLGASPFPETN
jgi:hypothetical protein